MKKLSKRFLSLFLAMLMLCSVMPAGTITAQAYSIGDTCTLVLQRKNKKSGNWKDYKYIEFKIEGKNAYNYYGTCTPFTLDVVPGGLSLVSDDQYISAFIVQGSGKKNLLFFERLSQAKNISTGAYNKEFAHVNSDIKFASGTSEKLSNIRIADLNLSWNYGKLEYNYRFVIKDNLNKTLVNKIINSFTGNKKASVKAKVYKSANIKTGNGKIIGYLSPSSSVVIVGVSGNQAKILYNGQEAWIDLYSCEYEEPTITKPPAPTITLNSATELKEGDFINFSWNNVTDAEYYVAKLYNSKGNCLKTIDRIYGTNASFQAIDPETYSVKVYGKNYMFDGDVGTMNKKVKVLPPNKVTYKNDDGTVLFEQKVPYTENATPPLAPDKKGYVFTRWVDDASTSENPITAKLTNLKADSVVRAEYEKKKYKVQFIDGTGKVVAGELGEQTVAFGDDATPPDASIVTVPDSNSDPDFKSSYEFAGWDSEKYKNVYNEDQKEPIKIHAVFNWINKDLPIACSNVRAERQPDGYTVYFNLQNYPDRRTRGRAVVALKTQSGRLVYTTESAAFSIAEGGAKSVEVFVPCDDAATVAEVYIIDSSYDGIPISNTASSGVDNALMWSNWLEVLPDNVDPNDTEVEPRTEYRYRNKIRTTNIKNTLDGYIWEGTDPVNDAIEDSNSPGAWSAWSWTKLYENNYRTSGDGRWLEVQPQENALKTAEKYNYYYYRYWNSSAGTYYYTYGSGMGGTLYSYSQSTPLDYYGNYDGHNGYIRKAGAVNFGNELWFLSSHTPPQYATRWRSRMHTYHYNFWKWDNWSDWSPEEVTPTENGDREVETRETVRYKSVSAGIEDNSGESHTFEGDVEPELAGKNITLFITKYKASSDFTNEFVGQTKIRDDGSYSFTYKLREEPTAETGDFTIKIGIEGESGTRDVDVIEAPKAQYKVTFYNDDGEIIDTQTVTESKNANLPDGPEVPGKTFICWNNTCTNVQSDLEVKPVYTNNKYRVRFVDWRKQEIYEKEFNYGEDLEYKTESATLLDENGNEYEGEIETTPEDAESGKFLGWDAILNNDGKKIKVTSDMMVQAVYDTNEYIVEFKDANGETVNSRTVEYGDSITVDEMPELPEDEYADYYEWDIAPEELMNIKGDITVKAVFDFDETTVTPTADVTTGHYDNTQTVSLSCEDESADIYYTTDGTYPKAVKNGGNSDEETQENVTSEVNVYTEPIEISEDTVLRFCASSFGKNDSEEATEYYAFGNSKILNVYNNFADDAESALAATFISEDIASIDNKLFAVDGFALDGVYTDSEYTNEADFENGTFGNVVNLYAKYTINSYTVTFKKDGETVSEQTVDYGAEATPPEMPKDGTKVFFEWDTDEYTFVEKDLTVNAVYKEESEITKITLSRDNYTMDQGDTFILEGEISGVDLPDDISIIWHSEDENVATVYDDGTVTATGSGETVIYAVTSDDSAVAECKITVNPSVNYSVTLKDSATVRFDSAGYLRNIPLSNNTVDNLLPNFKNSASSLEFKNANDEVISGDSLVGTGTVISLLNNGNAIHSITAIMTGDVTCDGKINNRDVVYAARVIVKKQTANDAQLLAMDVNGDGKVNNRDVAMLARYLVGKETIA